MAAELQVIQGRNSFKIVRAGDTHKHNYFRVGEDGVVIGDANKAMDLTVAGTFELAGSGTNGINISEAYTNGINISDNGCTNGINVTAACTTAINISAVQTDETGLDASCVFSHGTYSTALAYGTQTKYLILKGMHITVAATATAVMGDVNYITVSADSTGYVYAGYNYLSVGFDLVNGYATRSRLAITDTCILGEQASCIATLEIAASKTITATGAATLSAGIFDTEILAGAAVAQAVTCLEIRPRIRANVVGETSAIRININCTAANYVDYGLNIVSMSTNQTAAMRVYSNSQALPVGLLLHGDSSSLSGTITAAIEVKGTGSFVFDFDDAENGSVDATTTKYVTTAAGHILVKMQDGGTAYINCWEA